MSCEIDTLIMFMLNINGFVLLECSVKGDASGVIRELCPLDLQYRETIRDTAGNLSFNCWKHMPITMKGVCIEHMPCCPVYRSFMPIFDS